jgi:hypothetical protein
MVNEWLMNGLPTIWKVGLAPLKVKSHREDPSIIFAAKSRATR